MVPQNESWNGLLSSKSLLSVSKQMADALPEAPTPAPTKKPDPDRLNRVDSPGRPILQDFEGDTIAQEIAASKPPPTHCW